MLYIISFLAGGFFGMVFMCFVQVSRRREIECEYRMEQPEAESGKGGFSDTT